MLNKEERIMEGKKAMDSEKIKVKQETKEWQKPTLEDVSEKIMAQPYIRFT